MATLAQLSRDLYVSPRALRRYLATGQFPPAVWQRAAEQDLLDALDLLAMRLARRAPRHSLLARISGR